MRFCWMSCPWVKEIMEIARGFFNPRLTGERRQAACQLAVQ